MGTKHPLFLSTMDAHWWHTDFRTRDLGSGSVTCQIQKGSTAPV